MAKNPRLSEQQKAFADEYIANGRNVYKALVKAGYSESYAKSDGCYILDNPRVAEYIEKRMKPIYKARTLKIEEALALTSDIAAGKEGPDGRTPNDNTRLKALDMILRANGQYTDKVEVTGDIDVASILKQAKARAEKAKKSVE